MRQSLRFEILRRDEFTCVYCGRAAPDVVLHVDHIQPIAETGVPNDSVLNLATACRDCNLGKTDGPAVAAALAHARTKTRNENLRLLKSWRRGHGFADSRYDEGFEILATQLPPIFDVGEKRWFSELDWWMDPGVNDGAGLVIDFTWAEYAASAAGTSS
jgi:hypothetical protein